MSIARRRCRGSRGVLRAGERGRWESTLWEEFGVEVEVEFKLESFW